MGTIRRAIKYLFDIYIFIWNLYKTFILCISVLFYYVSIYFYIIQDSILIAVSKYFEEYISEKKYYIYGHIVYKYI